MSVEINKLPAYFLYLKLDTLLYFLAFSYECSPLHSSALAEAQIDLDPYQFMEEQEPEAEMAPEDVEQASKALAEAGSAGPQFAVLPGQVRQAAGKLNMKDKKSLFYYEVIGLLAWHVPGATVTSR